MLSGRTRRACDLGLLAAVPWIENVRWCRSRSAVGAVPLQSWVFPPGWEPGCRDPTSQHQPKTPGKPLEQLFSDEDPPERRFRAGARGSHRESSRRAARSPAQGFAHRRRPTVHETRGPPSSRTRTTLPARGHDESVAAYHRPPGNARPIQPSDTPVATTSTLSASQRVVANRCLAWARPTFDHVQQRARAGLVSGRVGSMITVTNRCLCQVWRQTRDQKTWVRFAGPCPFLVPLLPP